MKTLSPFQARKRLVLAVLAAVTLSGCASFSPDGGFDPVEQSARDRLGKDVTWVKSDADQDAVDRRVAELLNKPLFAEDAVQVALLNNKGLQAARLSSEQLANNLGLSKATRFINVLEVGAERNSSTDLPVQQGYTISLELPIFDWGTARVAKAEAIYMQSVNRTAATAINDRSEVRQAYKSYRSSFEIARHYRDEIVPLKKRISEENLLRYNGMLIGVFELLADARSQIGSVQGYIDALRDFWIAQADLDMALIGKPNLAATTGPAMAADSGAPTH